MTVTRKHDGMKSVKLPLETGHRRADLVTVRVQRCVHIGRRRLEKRIELFTNDNCYGYVVEIVIIKRLNRRCLLRVTHFTKLYNFKRTFERFVFTECDDRQVKVMGINIEKFQHFTSIYIL